MRKLLISILTLSTAGFMAIASHTTVQAAPVTMADGNLFDAQYYATAYPDVVAVFGTDANMLYMHYILAGKAEGRLPYAAGTATTAQTAPGMITLPDGTLFDPVFYATKYPDVAAIFGSDPNMLATHYMLCGKAEGRLPYGGTTPVAQTPVPTASVPGTYNGMVITDANWYTVPLNTLIDMGNYLYVVYDVRVYPDRNVAQEVFMPEARRILLERYPQFNTPNWYPNGYRSNDCILSWGAFNVSDYIKGADRNLRYFLYYGETAPGVGVPAPVPDMIPMHRH